MEIGTAFIQGAGGVLTLQHAVRAYDARFRELRDVVGDPYERSRDRGILSLPVYS